MTRIDEYVKQDATELAALVRAGDVTPGVLLDAAIEVNERLNPQLNAVIRPMYSEARREADNVVLTAPLAGVPFLLKDLGATFAGVPTRGGSRLTPEAPAAHDSNITRRHKAAGLVIFGKTNTPEFGLATATEPVLFGPTRNPWNLEYSAGGSSGGAAAAVAAGIVPVAHATDGGGSIRVPACTTGLFGLKPTRARTPAGPDVGEGWNGASCIHAVSRSVRDSAALLDATAGADDGAPYHPPTQHRPYTEAVKDTPTGLRIALLEQAFNGASVDADVLARANAAADACVALGHHVERVTCPIDGGAIGAAHSAIVFANVAALIDKYARARGRPASPEEVEYVTWADYEGGLSISASDYISAVQVVHAAGREFARFMADWDLILSPVMACRTPKLGDLDMNSKNLEAYGALISRMIGFTSLFNNTGCPAMSVPFGHDAGGMPVGVQFGARFGDEDALFRLAGQIESEYPWRQLQPPLFGSAG